MDSSYQWIKVAASIHEINFTPDNVALINWGEKKICLIRTLDGLKACASKCPHAGGDLANGFIDKTGNIVCPVHGYSFNCNTGRDTAGEGYFLKIYQVIENTDGIFIGLEKW